MTANEPKSTITPTHWIVAAVILLAVLWPAGLVKLWLLLVGIRTWLGW